MNNIRAGMQAGDHRKECCKKSENLTEHRIDKDRVIRVCKICSCRHFELTVDKGSLGLRGLMVG